MQILKDQGIQGVALASDRSSVDFEHAWAKHGIKPHLLEGYLTSNNPDFEAKAADVIGLYLEPAAECGGVQRR